MSTFTTDKASYAPGEDIVCTISGAGEAPDGATINGVAAIVQGGATSSEATITAPALSDFVYGGDHEATQFADDVALVLEFPVEADSDPSNIQIAPTTGTFYTATGSPADSSHEAGTAVGSPVYWEPPSTGAATIDTDGVITATELPLTIARRWYDLSLGLWSAVDTVQITLTLGVSQDPAGGLLRIAVEDRVIRVNRRGYIRGTGQFVVEWPQLTKSSPALLDYTFDWTAWLSSGETISAFDVSVPAGLTRDSQGQADGLVTAWISGGTDGQTYEIVCEITSSLGRKDLRRVTIAVAPRVANSNPFLKDPDAVLDYTWDWTRWLAAGETISSKDVTEPAALTLDSVIDADGFVTAWMSGGTEGDSVQEFPCRITTNQGRTDERMIRILTQER